MHTDGDRPFESEDEDEVVDQEQDLLVVLKLSNRLMGTAQERMAIEAFADQLEAAVTEAGVGEYDGDELGGGECILFFCGPDIDRLQTVLHPFLKRSPLCRGGHLVRMVDDADGEPQRQRLPI
ncbi:MAG: hypothetical protein IT456_02050 [Planctomycetes bacterium]|jgi:hypothetical protein|nr:hypothetical protein [Planctomycetota bacterium]